MTKVYSFSKEENSDFQIAFRGLFGNAAERMASYIFNDAKIIEFEEEVTNSFGDKVKFVLCREGDEESVIKNFRDPKSARDIVLALLESRIQCDPDDYSFIATEEGRHFYARFCQVWRNNHGRILAAGKFGDTNAGLTDVWAAMISGEPMPEITYKDRRIEILKCALEAGFKI